YTPGTPALGTRKASVTLAGAASKNSAWCSAPGGLACCKDACEISEVVTRIPTATAAAAVMAPTARQSEFGRRRRGALSGGDYHGPQADALGPRNLRHQRGRLACR